MVVDSFDNHEIICHLEFPISQRNHFILIFLKFQEFVLRCQLF
jgi:hypothetical protein